MQQHIQIALAPEIPADVWEVEALYDTCFAPGRTALSSYRLRDDVDPIAALCFTARDPDGTLAGAIRNWPVRVGRDAIAILLGPVAVHPTRQGEGVAALLMHKAIDTAYYGGWSRMLLVGDLPYYRRFGFDRLQGVIMPPPTNPDRVLGLPLKDKAWDRVRGQVSRAPDCNSPA